MYLRDMKPPPPKVDASPKSGADVAKLFTVLGAPPEEYTSDDMENDFTIAMQLLIGALPYLHILRDLQKHQDFMEGHIEQDFNDHIEAVEEFTNQW